MMAMTRENLRGNLNEVHEGGFRWLITTTLLLGVSDIKRGGNMRSEAQVRFAINGCKQAVETLGCLL